MSRRLAILIAAFAALAWASPVRAAEIKVLSAGAVKDIVTELAEAFRQETGHTVVLTTGTAGGIRQKVTAGEPADVLIPTGTVRQQLAASGPLGAQRPADIAPTRICV